MPSYFNQGVIVSTWKSEKNKLTNPTAYQKVWSRIRQKAGKAWIHRNSNRHCTSTRFSRICLEKRIRRRLPFRRRAHCMPLDQAVANRPFSQCYYNLPKLPPLPPQKHVDFRQTPKTPINHTHTTKLRRRLIDSIRQEKKKPPQDESWGYRSLDKKKLERLLKAPPVAPRQTTTFKYRYKLGRDIPVIPCRFTEHMMMFKKPPFAQLRIDTANQYKIRRTRLVNEKQSKSRDTAVKKWLTCSSITVSLFFSRKPYVWYSTLSAKCFMMNEFVPVG